MGLSETGLDKLGLGEVGGHHGLALKQPHIFPGAK